MTTTANSATNVSELERLKTLHNGTKQQLTFSDAEFERRLAGLRQIMAAKDLDAVILTSYHGIKYYSDFLYTTFGRNYALVVTADELDHHHRQHRRRHAVAHQLRRQHRLHRLAARQLLLRPAGSPAPRRRQGHPPRRRGRRPADR